MTGINCEIRVSGLVPDADLQEFEDMTVTVEPAETVLRGQLPDQAALYGMLHRIQLLGVSLIELRRLPDGDDDDPIGREPS